MNQPYQIETHIAPDGKIYTEEYWESGAAGWTIIKDSTGRTIPTSGSGGMRPWDNLRPITGGHYDN